MEPSAWVFGNLSGVVLFNEGLSRKWRALRPTIIHKRVNVGKLLKVRPTILQLDCGCLRLVKAHAFRVR